MTHDKILQAFGEFPKAKSRDEVERELAALWESISADIDPMEAYKTLFSCLDYTSLKSEDSEQEITQIAHRINDIEGASSGGLQVASLCVYPNQVQWLSESLTDERVAIASVVGGFPSGQTLEEVKVAEAALALYAGAQELDMTISYGAFLAEDYEKVASEIMEVKSTAGDALLKVILETGLLASPGKVQKASILALYSGADFIKTSTGKGYPGADPASVYVMCQTIRTYYEKHQVRRGIKISGGVSSVEEALSYYAIVRGVLGKEWLKPELFRIGSSRLLDALLQVLDIEA